MMKLKPHSNILISRFFSPHFNLLFAQYFDFTIFFSLLKFRCQYKSCQINSVEKNRGLLRHKTRDHDKLVVHLCRECDQEFDHFKHLDSHFMQNHAKKKETENSKAKIRGKMQSEEPKCLLKSMCFEFFSNKAVLLAE